MITIESLEFKVLRPIELKYLHKFIPQVKHAQAKTVLLTGDSGIGKTNLLNQFLFDVRKTNCHTIHLKNFNYYNVSSFYKSFIETFQKECNEIINHTLHKINSIYDENIFWEENDLKNILNIVKFQVEDSTNITPEKISKSIRGSMKLFSKVKPGLDESIDLLAEFLSDPWILIASNFGNPSDMIFKDAIALAKNEDIDDPNQVDINLYKDLLIEFFLNINNFIKDKDTALILAMDHFESISQLDPITREEFKFLLSEILEAINQQSSCQIMFLVSCSTEKQSLVLGGELYSNFTNKLLLAPLSSEQSKTLFKSIIESKKINTSEDISNQIVGHAGGNPFWIERSLIYLDSVSKIVKNKSLNNNFARQFLPLKIEETLNAELSLLYSSFSDDVESLDAIIKFIVNYSEPFSLFTVNQITGINELRCKEVLETFVKLNIFTPSTGEGYRYSHNLVKEFIFNQYKNKDYYNSQLINQLKLLDVIKHQILNKTDPSNSIRFLLEFKHIENHEKIVSELFNFLNNTINNDNPDIKISTIKCLKALNSLSSIEIINKAVNDVDARVRHQVLMALEHIIVTLRPENQDFESIITALKVVMFDKDQDLRIKSIEILGKINTKTSLDAIVNLLKDKDEVIRAVALKTIGKNVNNSNYPIIISRMKDPSSMVRVIAAELMGKLKHPHSIEILVKGLEDPSKAVRAACAATLGKLQYQETIKFLINALDDPDEDVKLNIIKSLGMLKNKMAIPSLKGILQQSKNDVLCWAAVRALGDIPCNESLELLNTLTYSGNSSNSIVLHAALSSLQKINTSLN